MRKNLKQNSATTVAKMGRCKNVTTDVLLRICEALDCQVEDIMKRVVKEK
ncbi:helix-turn-helix domain-containing protein [uncultured Lactobacillus sp.]|nr:helix-turn-helix domain-containing protein [uncultured Lactobacillus sp.]